MYSKINASLSVRVPELEVFKKILKYKKDRSYIVKFEDLAK